MEAQMSCPVCTLYLREGVSLQSHLNTHPKEQVIEALVKYYSAVKDGSNTATAQSTSEQFANQQNDQSIIESCSSTVPSQQYPCGSSSFTAAVTYQQFMSSNASLGGTVLPQCFSVPAIVATPTGDANQATLMPLFYNPYIIQQQQQQLQFYNSFRTIPQQPITRHILSPSHLFPIAQQFNITAVDHPVSQNSVTVSSSSTALQNTPSVQIVSSTASSQTSNLKHGEKSQTNDTLTSGEVKTRDIGIREASKESEPVQCNERGTSTEADPEEEGNQANAGESEMVLPTIYDEDINDEPAVPSTDRNARSNSGTVSQYNNGTQNKNLCLNDKNIRSDESVEVLCIDLENGDSQDASKSVRPNLHVKNDVNEALQEPEDAEGDNKEGKDQETGDGEHILGDIPFECCGSNTEPSLVKENNDDIKYETETSDVKNDQNNLEQDNAELIISDICPPEENEMINKQCPRGNNVKSNESNTSTQSATGQFNVVDIDGIHILVPSHYIESGNVNQKLVNNQISSHEPYSGFSGSTTLTEDKETETYPCINQDIQTDEVMPPMGELSGQESIGENDTHSWSQEKDEVSTSYDLLARESWEASDGSDDETDSMVVDDILKEPEPIMEKQVPKLEIKKEKLKCFYKCWCNEIFTCPKERRVHQSEKHGKKNYGPLKVEKKEWHDPLSSEKPKSNLMKQELKEEEDLLRSEEGLLPVSVELEEHPVSDTGSSMPLTEQCLREAKTVNELAKEGEDAFQFICSRCECVFASAKSLHRHMRTTHTNPFSCRTCDEKFPSEAEYLAHLKIHPLECSRCGKYFFRHQNLNLHIRRHLGIKPYKCTICDKAFVTKQKLAEHTNTHTGNTPIKCNLCSETFRRYSNLIQHKNRHHLKLKKKIRDYICHCGEIFHSQKKLQWHKEIHDEKPKTCNYCSERFVHASSLTRHIRKAHDQRYFPCRGRENENVECPVCGCIFLKSSLAVHMRLHSGERPFNCHICGKNFSTKWNLQLHRWTHASRSMKPYKCSLCKSAFIRHSEYTSHMHSHRNVRPYTCNYCGSQFIRKYNCIRHAREHEGEKSFTCEICQKAFHRRYYLKEHMRIHSGVRPFTCHICGKASSTKSNHNKHVKIHHAREAVNTEG